MKNEQLSTDQLISELNELIVKNYDASRGFKSAAENIHQPELKEAFMDCSKQRQQFADELQHKVRTLGGEPKHETSTLSAMHRAWMDIKSAVSSNEEEAILGACVTAEKNAVSEYDRILDEDIPLTTRTIVQVQRNVVNDTLQKIKILENAA